MPYLLKLAAKLVGAYILAWICFIIVTMIMIEFIDYGYSLWYVLGTIVAFVILIASFLLYNAWRGVTVVKNIWNAEVGVTDMPKISNPITPAEAKRLLAWLDKQDDK